MSNAPRPHEPLFLSLSRAERRAFYKAADRGRWDRGTQITVIEYAVPREHRRQAHEAAGVPHRQAELATEKAWTAAYRDLCQRRVL